jgi:hypothetical protein
MITYNAVGKISPVVVVPITGTVDSVRLTPQVGFPPMTETCGPFIRLFNVRSDKRMKGE